MDQKTTGILESLQQAADNTTCLLETSELFSSRMLQHQTHLEHLMGFKEQRRSQMDNHWCALEDLMTIVSEVIADSTTQSQRLMAQLDGLCSTTKQATTTACNNILDIRARMIPKLCTRTNALVLEGQSFHARLDAIDAAPTGLVSPPPSHDDADNTPTLMTDVGAPPVARPARNDTVDDEPMATGSATPLQPTHQSNPSWYGTQRHPTEPSPRPAPQQPVQVDTAPDPLLEGAITTPCLANKDHAAQLCHIS